VDALPQALLPKEEEVGVGHQGGALAPRRQVRGPEAIDHRDLQGLGQVGGLPQLEGGPGGLVPDGLAGKAHQLRLALESPGGLGVEAAQIVVQEGDLPGGGLPHGPKDPLSQGLRVGHLEVGQDPVGQVPGPAGKLRQDQVHPVGAGPRHDAQDPHLSSTRSSYRSPR